MPLGFSPIGSLPIGGLPLQTTIDEIVRFDCTATLPSRAIIYHAGFVVDRPSANDDDGHLYDSNSGVDTLTILGALEGGVLGADTSTPYLRFPNVSITEANTVDGAYLILTAAQTISSLDLVISAEDIKYAYAPTSYENGAAKPLTSANVSWSLTGILPEQVVTSPNLATVFQELVNRSDWLDPNAHAVQLFLSPTTGDIKEFYSHDQSVPKSPKLVVTWGGYGAVAICEAEATFVAEPYVMEVTELVCTASMDPQPNVNYRISHAITASAEFDLEQSVVEEEIEFICAASFLVETAVRRDVVVPAPTITYSTSTGGSNPDDPNDPEGPVNTLDPALQVGGIGVQIITYDTNGEVNSTSFMRLQRPSNLQSPATTPLKPADDIFELNDLSITYDNGKAFKFRQLGPANYGLPKYHLQDSVNLTMNLGFGKETYFRGRVKQINHVGDEGESIEYECWGIPNLADEVDIIGPYGDGYFIGQFQLPSTLTIPSGDEIAALISEPTLLVNAVQGFFDAMTNDLVAYGIPTNYDLNGLDKTVVVSENKRLSGGFFNALKDLVSVDPGVKVWFDDTDETWKFIRTMEAPILNLLVQDNYLQAHNWQEDSSDRFTAVILMVSGESQETSIPVTSYALAKAWQPELEEVWSERANSKGAPEFTTVGDNNELTDEQKVFREWYLTNPIGGVRHGSKCVLSYKVPRSFRYNVGPNGKFLSNFVTETDGFVWIDVPAEFLGPQGGSPVVQRNLLGFPGAALLTTAQPHARVRATVPIIVSGSPQIQGDCAGPEEGAIAVTHFLPIQLPDTFTVRWPPSGYAGDAFSRYGIRREKVINVDPHELTLENAKALHRLYSDIRVTCSLPIYGDPMRDMLRFMSGRISLTDIHGITGLENANALITGYTYSFTDDIGTIQVSSDLTNFLENLGKAQ